MDNSNSPANGGFVQASRNVSFCATLVTALLSTVCIGKEPDVKQALHSVRVSQFHMGMMVHLTLWAPTKENGRQAAVAAFKRIGEIDQIMSDYEPHSELSRLCRRSGEGPVPVSAEFIAVLAAARELAEATDGRFDPTIGPLTRLWRRARQYKVPPTQTEVEAAKRLVGYRQLILDKDAQTVELSKPGMWLDLGGIAKGYAGDEALRVLVQHGVAAAAVELGGDKVFGDPPPGEAGWRVQTQCPTSHTLTVANCAVSTSGDTVQYLIHNGKRISHVIDSVTGWGTSSNRVCIVIARRGLIADPLATIGTLTPHDMYRKLLERRFPEVWHTVFASPSLDPQSKTRIAPPEVVLRKSTNISP